MPTSQLSVYFFLQAAVIVLASQLVGRLARRLGQPQVVGEMIAGVLLGPSLFGLLLPQWQQALFPKATMGMLYVAAQLGVGLYMFIVGTEFRADLFRDRAKSAVTVSLAGIAAPFALAFALTPWLHTIPGLFAAKARLFEASLLLGAAIAINAFPMLARIIHERGLAGTSLGTLALTAGAFDDAAAWCILAIVLASFGGSWMGAYAAIGDGAAFALFMILVGQKWLRGLGIDPIHRRAISIQRVRAQRTTELDRLTVRRAPRSLIPLDTPRLQRLDTHASLRRTDTLERMQPVRVIRIAMIRIAGGLGIADCLAQGVRPLFPREDAALVQREGHRERLRFPRRAKHRTVFAVRHVGQGGAHGVMLIHVLSTASRYGSQQSTYTNDTVVSAPQSSAASKRTV
ncbi:Cation:proton antiporter [Candidatus Burkholderia humilis]|nr:Cation:proton antiporter [Candidatus Burkholderia humilis]